MKKLLLYTTSILGMAAILTTGCTKKIDEAYANPNADVKVPVEQLLPGIISCMGANSAGHGPYNDYRYLGKYIQNWHFCNSLDLYDQMGSRLIPLGSTAADQTASMFRTHYYDIGQNNMNMIKWAIEDKKWDYVGVGKAIFAWSWLSLTDLQGEVILDQAFDPSRLTFTYQTQEEVYTYVRALCHEALAYLSMTGDGVSQANLALGDAYMYNGDVNKWKKFVYAILARSFHHLTNKGGYQADSVIKYCDLSFASNADNAMQKFAYVTGGVTGAANFMGPARNNLNGIVAGSTTANRQGLYIVNLLTGGNSAFPGVTDPRAIYMLRKNVAGTFKGVEKNKGQLVLAANDRPESFYGIPQNLTAATNTTPSNDLNCRYIFRNTAPLPVITAAEIKFMKAEAAYRKADKLTAWNAYKEGILLNFDMLSTTYNVNIPAGEEITVANRDAYVNNPLVVPPLFSDITLSKIMLQKYIALFGIGVFETWTDMRRFHYTDMDPANPATQVYADLVIPKTITSDIHPNNLGKPVHRVYPRYNSETVWNIAELARIGADKDDFHTKEMWIIKP